MSGVEGAVSTESSGIRRIVRECYEQHSTHKFDNLEEMDQFLKKYKQLPWLVWLSGLGIVRKSKGHRFDSRSGHVPGLWARSPAGTMREATGQYFSNTGVSLPLFLPPFPSF